MRYNDNQMTYGFRGDQMQSNSELEENLKRGILEMLILKMLAEKDMYVYQMINEMNARGQGLINIKEGSLYGPIYRLVDKKYITEIKTLVGKRRVRVYYHLEPSGFAYFDNMKNVYTTMTKGIELIMNENHNANISVCEVENESKE